jgi:hypothetical protein
LKKENRQQRELWTLWTCCLHRFFGRSILKSGLFTLGRCSSWLEYTITAEAWVRRSNQYRDQIWTILLYWTLSNNLLGACWCCLAFRWVWNLRLCNCHLRRQISIKKIKNDMKHWNFKTIWWHCEVIW